MTETERFIEAVKNDFYYEDGEYIGRYDKDGNGIFEVIDNYFEENDYQYSIETDCLFESTFFAVGYLSIAWIEEDGLHHQVINIESR